MIWICWFYWVMTSVVQNWDPEDQSLEALPPFPCNVVIEPIIFLIRSPDSGLLFQDQSRDILVLGCWMQVILISDTYLPPWDARYMPDMARPKQAEWWHSKHPLFFFVSEEGCTHIGWNSVGSWALLLRRQYCLGGASDANLLCEMHILYILHICMRP